jgi:DNA repair photolyase
VSNASKAHLFQFDKIVLCRGSLATPERAAFVRSICSVYPNASVVERLDVPHNRIGVEEQDPGRRVEQGKRTLVFAVPNADKVVRPNETPNAIFPYGHSFSVYGFCPYNCAYCYLTASPGVWFSPVVKIYVNLPEILAEVEHKAREAGKDTTFCLGKHEDGLSLDPLTGYSTILVPFFARNATARLLVQTKSAAVERLLGLEHQARTTLSWTLSPPVIAERYESAAPSPEERIKAMQRAADCGYPVRANVIPVIPDGDWKPRYLSFIYDLVERVPLQQLTIGGIRIDPRGRALLEQRLGKENPISGALDPETVREHACSFYRQDLLDEFFRHISKSVGRIRKCTIRYDMHHARSHMIATFKDIK